MNETTKDLLLKIGVVLIIVSGLFPLAIGTVNYIRYQISYYNPDHPWGALPAITAAPYSLSDIRNIPDGAIKDKNVAVVRNNRILLGKEIPGFGQALANDLIIITQSGLVNIMNSGVMVILTAVYGIRERRRWAFFVIITIGVWAGFNSADALLRGHQSLSFALGVLPNIIGTIGVILAYPAVIPIQPPRDGQTQTK